MKARSRAIFQATIRPRLALLALLALPAAGAALQPRPAGAQAECRNVVIRSPFGGETLSGTARVLGSARIDRFLFYKVEWAAAESPETWSALSTTIDQPVVNGLLDQWDTSRVPDGRYRLKLTAVDQDSQERCRAIVEGLIVANTVTATPSPTPSATPAAAEEPDAAGDAADSDASAPTPPAAEGDGAGDEAGSPDAAEPTPTLPTIPLSDAPAAQPGALRQIGGLIGTGLGGVAGSFFSGFCIAGVLAAVIAVFLGLRRSR